MAKTNLEKMSLEELHKLEKDVAKAIAAAEKAQKTEALAAVQAAAKAHGFTLADLTGETKKPAKKPAHAKYAHPENPALTWSGRGRQPGWIKDAVASGKAMDDFLIGA